MKRTCEERYYKRGGTLVGVVVFFPLNELIFQWTSTVTYCTLTTTVVPIIQPIEIRAYQLCIHKLRDMYIH